MVVLLEKTEKGYSIPVSAETVETLGLTVGAKLDVQIQPVHESGDASPVETIGEDEALRLYEQSKKKFGPAYEALAK
jgi:hypothetical protein